MHAAPLALLRDARRPGEQVEHPRPADRAREVAEHRDEPPLRADVLDHPVRTVRDRAPWIARPSATGASAAREGAGLRGREMAPEVLAQRGRVHGVGPREPGAAGPREHEHRRPAVVGIGAALDEPVGLHALHQPAQAGLAVARVHQLLELAQPQPARGLGPGEVRERGEHARIEAALVFERAHDVVQHRLVHRRRARSTRRAARLVASMHALSSR